MNKVLHMMTVVMAAIYAFSSCDPDGTEIGDLYGRWYLKSADCPDGTIEHCDTLFLAFQGDAYQYQAGWGHHDWGSYRMTSDSLILNPLAYGGDFKKLGIDLAARQPLGFRLDRLTDKDLIISRNDSVWSLDKFLE